MTRSDDEKISSRALWCLLVRSKKEEATLFVLVCPPAWARAWLDGCCRPRPWTRRSSVESFSILINSQSTPWLVSFGAARPPSYHLLIFCPRTDHQQVETTFPLIDSDPHFKRVVSYMRPSDYAAWGGATVAFPSALYLMGASIARS